MKRTASKSTSNTFFGGAAILAASIIVVKIVGALYKIPLGRILGDVGFGHFNNAYAIFNLLLMVSTAGLPVAMSKTISEADALDRRNQVERVFRVALATFLVLGTVSALIMFVFAQPLADLRPAEDHVLHLVPPQGPGRLLPQHPANGIGEIGLAAAVGADNGGDGMVKGEHGVVREGFEALQFQCTQTQSGFPLPCIGVFGHGFSAPWAEKSMIHFIIATPTVFCNG